MASWTLVAASSLVTHPVSGYPGDSGRWSDWSCAMGKGSLRFFIFFFVFSSSFRIVKRGGIVRKKVIRIPSAFKYSLFSSYSTLKFAFENFAIYKFHAQVKIATVIFLNRSFLRENSLISSVKYAKSPLYLYHREKERNKNEKKIIVVSTFPRVAWSKIEGVRLEESLTGLNGNGARSVSKELV